MDKQYSEPSMVVVELSEQDVVCTSGPDFPDNETETN